MKSSVLLLALLLGCTMAPKMGKLSSPVSPVFHPSTSPGAQTAEGETKEIPTWKNFYQNEELQKLIELGLKNSRNLKSAMLAADEARGLYGIERGNIFPTVRVNGTFTEQRFPPNAINSGSVVGNASPTPIASSPRGMTQKLYGANVGITSYEIDFFGRLRSLKDAALNRYYGTEASLESVRLILISDIATSYYKILADQELVKIAQGTAASQGKTAEMIKNRFKAGIQNELEWRQAQALMENARADEVRYERQFAMDKNALELLVGSSLKDMTFQTPLKDLSTKTRKLTVGLDSKLLLQRPDIRRAEANLVAANADIGAARAAFFPAVSLTSNIGKLSRETSNLFESGSNSWAFNPTISLPIFAGGRLKAQLTVSKVRKDMRIAEYELAIQSAFREVSDALVSNEKLDEVLAIQQRVLEHTGTGYKLSKQRYDVGVDSYIVQLDSQREFYKAQTAEVGQELAYFTNLTYLYRAIGGGVN